MADRVLHLLSQRPGWTGSGMALNAIVAAATRAGWQQSVLIGTSPDEPKPNVGELHCSQIRPLVFENEALPYPIPGMSDVMPYRSSRFSALSAVQVSAYRNAWLDFLASGIEEFHPDLIHSHHVWLLSSLVKEVAPSIPVVTHCHGTGLRQLALSPKLAPQVRIGCARNDAFLVLHPGQSDELQRDLGVAKDRISVIGSGFREDIFHSQGRLAACGPVITYAGKLSHAKGVPWLLEATERLSKRVPGLVLNVAGSGSGAEADEIRSTMAAAKHVHFHGQLDPPQLAALLRRSSVFVLPSFFEGLPLVLIEAAACGCRIVATELTGVVGQLQSELGERLKLVPLPRLRNSDRPLPTDLPAFVQHLEEALETSLGQEAIETNKPQMAGMTWNSVFAKIEVVWRQLIATRKSP